LAAIENVNAERMDIMVRKLAIAAFALSALSSGVAQALGLGEATVQSALNQPLTAEIELVNIRDLANNEILTGLADRDEFLRAGVDRDFFLSDLRFKVEINQQGKAVIKVTSSKPVREPFLNFLVEVNWPSGRLLREYALLIDPPTFSNEPAAPVQVARTNARQRAGAPAQPANSAAPSTAVAVATGTVSSKNQGDSYGPTQANDTMWSIAMKTRPDSTVSPQKMMLAIQDLNPDAFLNGNINKLKKGQVLRLPTDDEINVRSSREAIATVVAQNRDFKEGSSRTVEATAEPKLAASATGKTRDELRIVVDQATDRMESGAAASGTGRSAAGRGNAANGGDIALVQEQLDRTNRENEELQSRLEDLQQQLETMQRLVSLKDDQLAAMQGQAGLEQAAANGNLEEMADGLGETASDLAENTVADDLMAAANTSMTADSMGSEPAMGVSTSDAATPMPAESMDAGEMASSDDPDAVADTSETASEDAQSMASASSSIGTSSNSPQAVVPEAAPEQISMLDQIIDGIKNNIVYQGALAAGGVLLLFLLWLSSRRKSEEEEEFDEIAADVQADEAVLDLDQVTTDTVSTHAEESTDPIAEADVYIAYQKHEQAVRVLEDALEEQPDNHDYRLKLLEVLGESKKASKFAATLGLLEATGDVDIISQTSEIKARYADLVSESEISLDDLESQLLVGDSLTSDDELVDAELSDDFELDVDMEDSTEFDDAISKSEAEADFLEKNDFDLSAETEIETEDNLDIDFDLSDIDLDDTNISSSEPQSDLGEIDFEEDDLAAEPELSMDEEDTVLSPAPLDSEYDLENTIEDEELPDSDDMEIDEEFAQLDDYKGLLSEEDEEKTTEVSDTLDEKNLELDIDDVDISLDEEVRPSFDEVMESVNLEDTINYAADEDDAEETILAEEELAEEELVSGDLEEEEIVDEGDLIVNDRETDDTGLDDTVIESADLENIDLESTINDSPEEIVTQDISEEQITSGNDIVADMEDDFDFLSDTDEAATKLDLARAYVDMGDKEGAKDILEEVAEEGSDEQRQEAVELLKGLG
jgi:pilus assembly protein FimV